MIVITFFTDLRGNSKKLAYHNIMQIQHGIFVVTEDTTNNKHSIVAVNDTMKENSGNVVVQYSNCITTLFTESFNITVSTQIIISNIPVKIKLSMWLIYYTSEKEKYSSHYLVRLVR
jgi:hypothetical protein